MENRKIQFRSKACNLHLSAYPGHFATKHSHVNYFLDMTTLKVRQSNAEEAARALVPLYKHNTVVDTIVCLDGTEVIGAFLAEKLTESGFFSYNQHKSIYIVTPEIDSDGQMFFRKNIQPMIKGKHVLLLLASATTGRTIERSLECISYYGGLVAGVSAIFSASDEIAGQKVHTLFKADDLPNYSTYPHNQCPMCQRGSRIEAIVNSYGYSKL